MCQIDNESLLGRIILVESNNLLCRMMEMALQSRFQIVSASSAEEGLALAGSEAPFDAVISSFTLPGMDGLEFLRKVGEMQPATLRILMSGGSVDSRDISFAISQGHISRFVEKPFHISTLLDLITCDLASARSTVR